MITTPHNEWHHTDVRQVLLTSLEGEMAILQHHEPMIFPFRIGLINVTLSKGTVHNYFSQSGVGRIDHEGVALHTIECIPSTSLSRTDIEEQIAISQKRSESLLESSEQESVHNDLQVLQAKLEIIKRLKTYHE